MEDQIRADTVVNRKPAWIVSPAFDLLLIANLGWLLLLLPGFSTDQDTLVDFWQVYFLTLPHRWITLFLVVADADRRAQKTGTMIVIASIVAALVAGSYWGLEWGPRAFICLGFVDYVWNGWHFGSQHAGVVRIYSRKVGSGWPQFERWGVRTFVFLTILRTSSALLWPQEFDLINSALPYMDWVLLAIPLTLWLGLWVRPNVAQIPKLLYTSSFLALYSLYLLSSHFHWQRMILCLATAAALFHAVEYLAIVSYYARRRETHGSQGVMRWLAERWAVTLTCFVLTLGMLGVYLSGYQGGLGTAWQGLNLWAALLHYAFDGMIWKLRNPATAQSLGVA